MRDRVCPSGVGRDDWELAAERIIVKIRWFGVAMGLALVQTRTGLRDPSAVRAFLALGAGYAALDVAFFRMGEVFLGRVPALVALMESTFIALLCYHDVGVDSPFRWYYLLSLICCAIRFGGRVAWPAFGFHCVGYLSLIGATGGAPTSGLLTLAILAWATWAGSALASVIRETGTRLARANAELQEHGAALERRVAERSEALRASEARTIQHEKMAAFGQLAAGIAHEVGNPLTALDAIVQLLRRRDPDPYALEKLELAARQLDRIGRTVRELVDFSRPASTAPGRFSAREVVDEALAIAKYHQRGRSIVVSTELPADLPAVRGVRDHLAQVILNLVLNAVDAAGPEGTIRIVGVWGPGWVELLVEDDGPGIGPADRCRLFRPYFTTKPSGTGLGLFVSRQIVEESGGTLTYRTAVGRGTTFVVRLPVDEAVELARPAEDVVGAGR